MAGNRVTRIMRAEAGALRAEVVEDAVAVEEPVEVVLRYPARRGAHLVDYPLSVTMRTPGDDEALAIGLIYCEGLISGVEAVREVEVTENRVTVELGERPIEQPEKRERRFLSSSSCGVCGKTELTSLVRATAPPFTPDAPLIPSSLLSDLPQRLRAAQAAFHSSGGLHATARFGPDGVCRGIFEDVGRHNALDKLVGDALRRGQLPAFGEVLILSGRVSYELVQKSLAAGFPVVAALGAPSSLAVEMSNAAGQTLVGFLRRERFNVYSHPQRILSSC